MILTRSDLGTFAHIHPAPTGTPGRLRGHHHLPDRRHVPRPHRVPPQGQMSRRPRPPPRSPSPDRRLAARARLRGPLHRDERAATARRHPRRADRRRRRGPAPATSTCGSPTPPPAHPVTGIQPYLGAAGHVVILRNDGTRFAHAHAETTDSHGRPVFAIPGTSFGPDLDLHTRFAPPAPTGCGASSGSPDGRSSPPRSSSTHASNDSLA